ncbi:MAG: hypothetical protein JWO95_445 [Verrucomicrobiales bacterium]|nr:hypothetical protein [Verrucomicrobiales bacterium]
MGSLRRINLCHTVRAVGAKPDTRRTDSFGELFTDDALVSDESHQYRGAAIKSWIDQAIATYKAQTEVTEIALVGGQTIATAQVSGTFLGSPVQVRYQFTLHNGKIAALAIGT